MVEVVVSKINLYCGDSLQAMREMDDNQYDLAIVDPPYGIQITNELKSGFKTDCIISSSDKDWDNEIPPPEYFVELMRVSKNQIIWGGNYFLDYLYNTRCMLVWDKNNGSNNMADCELAWTSFHTSVRKFTWHHLQGTGPIKKPSRIHPTQKPVSLYLWLLDKYAKKGDRILDTHLGSGSIAIACHDMGFDLDGWELDTDYYHSAVQRFENHTKQIQLF